MGKLNQSRQSRRTKEEYVQQINLPIHKQTNQPKGEFKSDYPDYISSHRLINNNELQNSGSKLNNYLFKLEWKERSTGITPIGTEFKYQDLKQVCPSILMKYLSQYVNF